MIDIMAVNPFFLDVKRDVLADIVRQRILATEALSAGLRKEDRKQASEEVVRLNAWLDTIVLCQDEEITLAVVEEIALEELGRLQRGMVC